MGSGWLGSCSRNEREIGEGVVPRTRCISMHVQRTRERTVDQTKQEEGVMDRLDGKDQVVAERGARAQRACNGISHVPVATDASDAPRIQTTCHYPSLVMSEQTAATQIVDQTATQRCVQEIDLTAQSAHGVPTAASLRNCSYSALL